MMADEDDEILDAIEQDAIDGIQKASGDQGSVEKMTMDERIKAANYVRSRRGTGGFGGLKLFKLVPGDAE
jgi:hypothetical protein